MFREMKFCNILIELLILGLFGCSYSFTLKHHTSPHVVSTSKSRSNIINHCTSIRPTDVYTEEEKKPFIVNKDRKERFVHPQVLKMFRRAQDLLREGNNTIAAKLLTRCLELNPFDSHSWLAMARLEERLCNYQKSRDLFSQALEKCPNNVHILHAWGVMEERHGSEEIARECWSQAREIEPLNAYVCHALSSLEKKLRNYDRARSVLEDVVNIRPTAALCVALADIQRLQGFPENSKDTLLYGLRRCRTERSKILLALAWLEEDVFNNVREASKWLEEAIEIDKLNVKIYLAKANMELRQHRIEDARKTLDITRNLPSQDAQHYTMLSSLEIDHGSIERAIVVMEEGARKFPGDQYLLQRWGSVESKRGNIKKARELFERSIQIKPHAPSFVAWAMLEEEQGLQALTRTPAPLQGPLDLEDIESLEGNLVDLSFLSTETTSSTTTPTSTLAHTSSSIHSSTPEDIFLAIPKLAQPDAETIKYANNQFSRTRELFQLGLLVDPRHGPLYHAYATMEMRHGNYSGARDILLQGIHRNSSDITTIYHGWGQLELRDNNINRAAEIFRAGIELGIRGNREIEHGVSFLLHSLGSLELHGNNIEEAKRIFTTGVELYPHHSQLLLGLALTLMKLGENDEARKFFKESVDADSKHSHAWQAWAVAEKSIGNFELARVLFKQGLKKRPDHGALWQAYAMMEFQQGNVDIARTLFAQSILRAPTHSQSYQAWACLEVRAGNIQQAKMLAVRGLRQSPDHPALYTVAGVVEDRLGDASKARSILETGIKRFPSHGPLFKALGEIESRQGGYKAALLEAKLGNIEGLSVLHQQARAKFQNTRSTSASSNNDAILERISKLEVSAIAKTKGIQPSDNLDEIEEFDFVFKENMQLFNEDLEDFS
eukprot:gene3417-6780_t